MNANSSNELMGNVATLNAEIEEYLRFIFALDPIEATRLGVHEHDARLSEVAPERFEAAARTLEKFRRRLDQLPAEGLDADQVMDRAVAQIDVKLRLRRLADLPVWRIAPYWYPEQLGSAFSGVMRAEERAAEERGRNLLARLEQAPAFLAAGLENLTAETPPLHVEMGVTGAQGLRQFVDEAVVGFAQEMPTALQADLRRAATACAAAIDVYVDGLERFSSQAQGEFACGVEHFDFLLREFHLLDHDHRTLYEFGLEQMAQDKAKLENFARSVDASRPWAEQIEAAKDEHPPGEAFLETYGAEMRRARQHCVDHDLITLPPGEKAQVKWLPGYLRAVAPLGLMSTTAPFGGGLASDLLITPLDSSAPPETQRQHQRDNCYAFTRSITFHELYPGHHLQKVHHKLATTDSPIRRYFSCPVFVEGWGLYTEDLMEETGFMEDPAVRLFKLRNALWRSVRVVVDSGLHTRNLSFEGAVDFMCQEVGLDRRMAAGEVRRYTTYNNPTYPSAYLLGKEAVHALRRDWAKQQGAAFTLRAFHDKLLSYGSPPLALVAGRMLGNMPGQ